MTRITDLILFVIVCGLPLGWLFTAARALRPRQACDELVRGS